MSTGSSSIAPSATSGAPRAPPQAGIFEGLNPVVYNPSDPIILFIIQASIVIALCRLLYWPLSKIRQPPVIAEVISGILLGPSVCGRIPGFTDAIFPRDGMAPFTLAANIGLILYLFLVGLEIDLRFLTSNWRIATSVASLDMAIPFGMGYAIAYGLYHQFKEDEGIVEINYATYGLFIAIAIAITAFPVLCRILTSLNLLNSNVGVIVLSSGIANDVVGWILLALCVTLVNTGSGLTSLYVFLTAVGFALFLAFAVRPAFMWVLRRTHSLENGPTQGVVALTIFMVLASAFFTSVIGAHSVFGAFMVGLMCPHQGGFAIKLTEKLEDLIATLFLPLFFARSGLNTNLGLLDSGIVWGYVVAVIVIAFASKIFGGMMGARLNGLVWRESLTIGVLMSCKGLVELIVLNIGLQARILSTRTFTMFVVMALVTTFATTPLVSFIYPPSYQRKLRLWKQGKIDWDGNPLHSEDDDLDLEKRTDVAGRLLVYLRADGLSSLLSIVKLFTRNQMSASSDATDSLAKGPFPSQPQHSGKRLRIHSIRLTEVKERNSSMMKLSEHDAYAGNDPIIKAFGLTACDTTSRVVVSGQVTVTQLDMFAETITMQASNNRSDFILIPWSETGSISELPSYIGGASQRDPLSNRDFARLTEEIFDKASGVSSIGVFLDRTLVGTSDSVSAATHGIERLARTSSHGSGLLDSNIVTYASLEKGGISLHVFYTGTDNDLFAVRLALQFARNEEVSVTITELVRTVSSSSEMEDLNDSAFRDLKSHVSDLAIGVNFETVEGTVVSDAYLTKALSIAGIRQTIFVLGRATGNSQTAELSSAFNRTRALGTFPSQLIDQIRRTSLSAGLLVVQANGGAISEKHAADSHASQK